VTNVLSTPRPVPVGRRPAVIGSLVVVLALPAFVVAGWNIDGWAIAAGLWAAYLAVGVFLGHVPVDEGNLAAAGMVAVGRMTRTVVLASVLIVVAVKDSGLGLPAAVVFGLAFTVEFLLSLFAYFGGEAGS